MNEELLNILACPVCKADVRLEGKKIVCVECEREYSVRDGIPVMLVDESGKEKERRTGFRKDDFKTTVLSTLLGITIVSLILAAVDAIRVIILFDHLFLAFWDKLLLVFTSILLYMGISVFVWFAAAAGVKLFFAVFRKKPSSQWYSRISICLVTIVTTLPLVLLFYNYKIRFLFPLKDHIPDMAIIVLLCLLLGILSGRLFCRKTKSYKWTFKAVVLVFILPLIVVGLIHVRTKDIEVNKQSNKPNIILIVIDTLRADHLGCYGYNSQISPNIDMLAKESVLFQNAFAQAPWTLPSIISIMTSLYPSVHGLDLPASSGRMLDEARKTLAEYLKEDGYKTAAFVGAGGNVSAGFHSQGFDFYDDKISYSSRYNCLALLNMMSRGLGFCSSRLADTTTELVNYWLSRNKSRPFFLFLHYFDPHDPYGSPEPFTTRYCHDYDGTISPGVVSADLTKRICDINPEDVEYVTSLYDGEIYFSDVQIGKLIGQLKSLDMINNTMIILTADHGEEFLEHGRFGHGKMLYDTLINVPLMIKYPSLGSKSIEAQVQLIDIVPTILDYLGIAVNNEAQGVSLYPLIKGEIVHELPAYSETQLSESKVIALRTRNYKFIRSFPNGSEELFDLHQDPGELNNLIEKKPEITSRMRQKLLEWLNVCKEKEASLTKTDKDKTIHLDDKTMEELRSLGYLQ